MTNKRSRNLLTAILVVVFAAVISPAQTTGFDRARTYDVQHYVIRVSFDHTKRTVFGDTTVRLKPLADGFKTAELDAAALAFESVTLEPSGARLDYRTAGEKVFVTLDREYKTDEEIAIRFKYSAKPKKGVYFVNAEKARAKGDISHSEQIWTQGEPEEAHHWFPSFDFPSDKATTEKFLTVKKGMTAIGNGELVSETENADGTVTFHYRMPIPHPTYLVSFVIGEYKRVSQKFRDIELGYYMYPDAVSIAPLAYSNTVRMLEELEKMTGVPYPFNKYDQTIVSDFEFGGMENITATTMADEQIFYSTVDFLRGGVEDLVAHEIAHSWFGNNVTCKNWAELWLNEGFATFIEAAVREKMYGRSDYLRKLEIDAENYINHVAANSSVHGLYNRKASDLSILFKYPAVTYSKGGTVIHMLREEVGDAVFWKGVNLYLTRHRFETVETSDLIRAMEEASGKDLDWFFDQWVYGTGYPKLKVTHSWNAASKELVVTVEQIQKADASTPVAFRLPLEIDIIGNSRPERRTLDVRQRVHTERIALTEKPNAIEVDPDLKLIMKSVKLNAK